MNTNEATSGTAERTAGRVNTTFSPGALLRHAMLYGSDTFAPRGGVTANLPPACPPELFARFLSREHALTQRGNYSFSVLEFELQRDAAHSGLATTLEHVVTSHIRETDIAGWLRRSCLGVILPATSAPDAERLVERIAQALPPHVTPLRHSAYEYGPASFADGGPRNTPGTPPPPAPPVPTHARLLARIPRWKRLLDIVCSSLALVVLTPLFIVLILAIEIVSPGPFLFRQERIGHLGRRFQCLKFRSMRVDTNSDAHREHVLNLLRSDAPMTKLETLGEDPRLIPLGRVFRATGLDELPQLINVLAGDMSLVGPRPCVPYEFAQFKPWYRMRCLTPPGLTGLWQVNGKNKTTFEQMMRYDVRYAKSRSLHLDLAILLRTPGVVVSQLNGVAEDRLSTRYSENMAVSAQPQHRGAAA
jgi:lipopolysaccharide/colanic/teichoic acid biosynthesis glycosyltransferase